MSRGEGVNQSQFEALVLKQSSGYGIASRHDEKQTLVFLN